MRALFELGLVVLSSLAGAALVIEGLGRGSGRGLLFAALAAAGIVAQLAMRRERRKED